jgi:copper chaperone
MRPDQAQIERRNQMTTLSIPEMSCGHCKATIEKTIKAIDPAAALQFDLEARRLDVESSAPMDVLRAALATAGYQTTPA